MTEIRSAVDWWPDFCRSSGMQIAPDDPRPGVETFHPEFLRETTVGSRDLQTFMVPLNDFGERTWFSSEEEAREWLLSQQNNEVLRYHLQAGPVWAQIIEINSDGDPSFIAVKSPELQ